MVKLTRKDLDFLALITSQDLTFGPFYRLSKKALKLTMPTSGSMRNYDNDKNQYYYIKELAKFGIQYKTKRIGNYWVEIDSMRFLKWAKEDKEFDHEDEEVKAMVIELIEGFKLIDRLIEDGVIVLSKEVNCIKFNDKKHKEQMTIYADMIVKDLTPYMLQLFVYFKKNSYSKVSCYGELKRERLTKEFDIKVIEEMVEMKLLTRSRGSYEDHWGDMEHYDNIGIPRGNAFSVNKIVKDYKEQKKEEAEYKKYLELKKKYE